LARLRRSLELLRGRHDRRGSPKATPFGTKLSCLLRKESAPSTGDEIDLERRTTGAREPVAAQVATRTSYDISVRLPEVGTNRGVEGDGVRGDLRPIL